MLTSDTIKRALNRAATLVEKRPEVGQRDYTSKAYLEDGLLCAIHEKGWQLSADVPEAMGGENFAPSPSTLFRAAVSSCVAIGIKMWAARMDVPIAQIHVVFTTHVDARGQFAVADDAAPGFESAALDIELSTDADAGAISRVVETSLRYSAMMDAIKGRFPIDTKILISKTSKTLKGAA